VNSFTDVAADKHGVNTKMTLHLWFDVVGRSDGKGVAYLYILEIWGKFDESSKEFLRYRTVPGQEKPLMRFDISYCFLGCNNSRLILLNPVHVRLPIQPE
jgi:hypothetical protein